MGGRDLAGIYCLPLTSEVVFKASLWIMSSCSCSKATTITSFVGLGKKLIKEILKVDHGSRAEVANINKNTTIIVKQKPQVSKSVLRERDREQTDNCMSNKKK